MQSKASDLRPFGSDGWILIPNETPDKTAPVFHHLRSNTFILMRLRRSVTSRNWIMKLDKINEVEIVRIHFWETFSVWYHPEMLLPWQRDVTIALFYSLTQLMEIMQYQRKRVTAYIISYCFTLGDMSKTRNRWSHSGYGRDEALSLVLNI